MIDPTSRTPASSKTLRKPSILACLAVLVGATAALPAPAQVACPVTLSLGPLVGGTSDYVDAIFADTDLDGDVEVVMTLHNLVGPAWIEIHETSSDGSLTPTSIFPSGGRIISTIGGDFDSDGVTDLVVNEGRSVGVYLGDGVGGFGAVQRTTPTVTSHFERDFRIGDFNVDGNLDAVFASGSHRSIVVMWGDGTGALTEQIVPVSDYPYDLAVGDISGDGIPDVIGRDRSSLWSLHSDGLGGFVPGPSLTVPSANLYGAAIFDVDRDGALDVVTCSFANFQVDNNVAVFLGNGRGGFSMPNLTTLPCSRPRAGFQLEAADFNQDGFDELLIWRTCQDQVFVLPGTGTPTFGSPLEFHAVNVNVGDLDRDGDLDFLTISGSPLPPTRGRPAAILNGAAASSYGHGVRTLAATVPNLEATASPRLGGSASLRVSDATPGVMSGALLVGRDRAYFRVLDGALLVDRLLGSSAYTLASGTASLVFAVPPACGASITFQAIGIDLGPSGVATASGLTFSNGVEWVIGR